MIDRRAVLASNRLPALAPAAVRVVQIVRGPDPDLRQLAAAVRSDPVLSARVLKTINSSLFSLSKEIVEIDQAIVLLGTSTVASLAAGFSLLGSDRPLRRAAPLYRIFWRTSIVHAAAAEALAEISSRSSPVTYFTTGLLLDVGILSLLRVVPDEYAPVLQQASEGGVSLIALEDQQLGINHVEVAAVLAKRWRLPAEIRAAIEHHHEDPLDWKDVSDATTRDLQCAAVCAAAIAELANHPTRAGVWRRLVRTAHVAFRLDEGALERLIEQAFARVREIALLFGVDVDPLPSATRVISAARRALSSNSETPAPQHPRPAGVVPPPPPAARSRAPRVASGAPTPQRAENLRRTDVLFALPDDQQQPVARQTVVAAVGPTVKQGSPAKLALDSGDRRAPEVVRAGFLDQETDAYSGPMFEECFQREYRRSVRYEESLGLVLVALEPADVERGPDVMRAFYRRLKMSVRDTDMIARADEWAFAVLLLCPLDTGMGLVVERIRHLLEAPLAVASVGEVTLDGNIGAVLSRPAKTLGGHRDMWQQVRLALEEARDGGARRSRIIVLFDDLAPPSYAHPPA